MDYNVAVPNVLGAVSGGLQAGGYISQRRQAEEDRKRQLAESMDEKKKAALNDTRKILSTINPDDENFDQESKWAAGWLGTQHPDYAKDAMDIVSMPIEERRAWFKSNRALLGVDKEKSIYERGKPFVNEEGERVIPIYNKQTQEVVRTEKLGKAQAKSSVAGIVSEREMTLGEMLANNEIDVTQLPKRGSSYNNIVSYAKTLNPDLNVRQMTADYSLSKNPTFRQRALTAEVLPDILDEVVRAGKKIDFSNIKKVGGFQKFYKSQTNDPDLVEYMALRNDALMELASVMRGGGMTDKAHAAEEEAMNPTMSPAALDAWSRAQLKALKPRLAIQKRIMGERGTAKDIASEEKEKQELTYNPETGGFD